jgi:hypothetical protein
MGTPMFIEVLFPTAKIHKQPKCPHKQMDKENVMLVVHACNPSYLEGGGRRIMSSRSAGAKLARLYLKTKYK